MAGRTHPGQHAQLPDTPLPREASAALGRRRRAKNLLMLAALIGLVALFYAISFARLLRTQG